MKRLIVIIAVIILLVIAYFLGYVMGLQYNPSYGSTEIPTTYKLDGNKLFSLVNSWRKSQNLPEYTEDNRLCKIAEKRLTEIKTNFSHDGYYKYWEKQNSFSKMGENLIKNSPDDQSALNGWLNSASHAANLKRNFTHSCLKCSEDNCVQIFGYY